MRGLQTTSSRLLSLGIVPLWLGTLACGAGVLSAYASRAGDATESPAAWPVSLPRHPGAGVWTVTLAAHPRCPCTRASIAELTDALSHAERPYELVVLAYEPEGLPGFSAGTTIAGLASRTHTRIVVDVDGRQAALLGGLTSGHVAVYDPAGKLRFAGGVTPTRSHTGPNTGAASVRALLCGREPPSATAPVFGCPIQHSGPQHNDQPTPTTTLGTCTSHGASTCQP